MNIEINDRYLCIQEGFEWKDIPSFAIITGINGVGKTQLLNILRERDEQNRPLNIPCQITDEDGHDYKLVVSTQENNGQSVTGLIEYFRNHVERSVQKEDLERSIGIWQSNIEQWQQQLLKNKDINEKTRLEQRIINLKNDINNNRFQIASLSVYAYDEELKSVARKCNKEVSEINETDIYDYANPYFNTLTEIEDFREFLRQENEIYKTQLAELMGEAKYDEAKKLSQQEKSYQIINRLFRKYNYNDYEMLKPYDKQIQQYNPQQARVSFQGKNGEVVGYEGLSSGEKVIVKLIIWAMGTDIRGNRINAMLLDEPDAHLHPSMCKMMVEILSEISKPKEEGGSGIHVIISTHSPSTVAFAPEGSLFVMEKNEDNNRIIRPTTTEDAVNILSNGIFTFEKAISKFCMAVDSSKSNVFFVEGKTDVNHLTKAIEILEMNIDIDIIDMHDAGALCNFIRSTPAKILHGKKIIALFDCDDEGKREFKKISGDERIIANVKRLTSAQSEGKSFALTLQPPSGLEEYCPIEFLYPFEHLKSHEMLEKRNYNQYKETFKGKSPEEDKTIANEYENETSLRPFKVLDCKKNEFSESIKVETDRNLFANFELTLKLIKRIVDL